MNKSHRHVHMHLNMHTAKCAKEFVRVLNDTVAPYLREEWLFPLFNIDQQFLNRFKVASISQLWEHLPSVDTFLVVARGRPLLWSGGRSQKCNWAFYVSLCMWKLLHATEHPIVSLCMWQLLQHRMPSSPASVVLQQTHPDRSPASVLYSTTYKKFSVFKCRLSGRHCLENRCQSWFLKQPVVDQTAGRREKGGKLVQQIVNSCYFPYTLPETDSSQVCHGRKIQGAVVEQSLPLGSFVYRPAKCA